MSHQIARDSLIRAERIAHDLVGRSFLKEQDLTVAEWSYLLDLAQRLKLEHVIGMKRARLTGHNLVLVFESASTSTRCAFEVAAHHQAAHVTQLDVAHSHVGSTESVKDTARELSRMYDGIAYRGSHATAELLARYADVPVWNALTDAWHPTQSLADMFTLREAAGKADQEIALAFCGNARHPVASSLLVAGAMLGMDVRMVAPEPLWNPAAVVATARALAATTGARITQTADPAAGLAGVDAVYTAAWMDADQPASAWHDRIALLAPYRVDAQLLELTGNPEAKLMHCLPAVHNRECGLGERLYAEHGVSALEVTEEVFESDRSIVFDQAENRMHTIEAVLVATLGC